MVLCGISNLFRLLSPCLGQIVHALLTRPPLTSNRSSPSARLACVKHAASVRPEPGSNSDVQSFSSTHPLSLRLAKALGSAPRQGVLLIRNLTVLFLVFYLRLCIVFKFRCRPFRSVCFPRSRRQVLFYHSTTHLSSIFSHKFLSHHVVVHNTQHTLYNVLFSHF